MAQEDARQWVVKPICHGLPALLYAMGGLPYFWKKSLSASSTRLAVLIPLGGQDLELGESGL